MSKASLATASIEELYIALRDGAVTAGALAEEALANQERFAGLNAYRTIRPDAVRAEARAADAEFAAGLDFGALQGMPVSVKDIYGVGGYPTYAGSPKALPEVWQAEGPVVRAFRESLAVVSGKSNTVEFAFGGVGMNPHAGTPRNPWHATEHRAPGGSSAGAGVSLLAGTAVVAIGSDTAGSVRIPASVTGTVGVKTSARRWSTAGIVPLSPTLDTAGILARSAEDAAIAFALVDPWVEDPPLAFLAEMREPEAGAFTVGIVDWMLEDASPAVARGVEAAIAELSRAGLKTEKVDFPEMAASHVIFLKGGLAAPEFAAFLATEIPAWRATLDPNVGARFATIDQLSAVEYLTRRSELERLSRAAAERFAGVDLVLGPTVPLSPPDIATLGDPAAYVKANLAMLRNTAPVNLLTLSAVTIPVALDDDGMPVSLQIIAPAGEDERAITAACAFERVLGQPRQRLGVPPLCRI